MEFWCRQMISFNDRLCYWSVVRFPLVADSMAPSADCNLFRSAFAPGICRWGFRIHDSASCSGGVPLVSTWGPPVKQRRTQQEPPNVIISSVPGRIGSFCRNWSKAQIWAVYNLESNPKTQLQFTCCSPPQCRGWWCHIASSSKAPGWSQSQLLWPRRSPADQSARCCRSWIPHPGAGKIPNRWVLGERKKGEKEHTVKIAKLDTDVLII